MVPVTGLGIVGAGARRKYWRGRPRGEQILARFPSDGLIEWLAGAPLGGLRRWASRKAADRAMHWAALKGAPGDPYLLARLGLFPLAAGGEARDAKARFGQAMARAALGEGGVERLSGLTGPQRRLAARTVALHDIEAAMTLLAPDDREAIAACLIALGRPEEARAQFFPPPDPRGEKPPVSRMTRPAQSPEFQAILAHILVSMGDYDEARRVLNDLLFLGSGSAVLEPGDGVFGIDDLAGSAKPITDGPKVSVIIPYHDNEATLDTAIRSIASQSWRNLEILLVDDRSGDNGPDIVRRHAEADPRIVALSNTRTPGVYGARNTAIEAASGDYIAFLDADDWSPARRIARQIGNLDNHAVTIANHIRMDDRGRPVAPRVFPLVRPVPITLMTRRQTLIDAGPFEEVPTGADSEMLARLEMLHGKQAIHRDPAVLLVARWQSGSLSQASEGGMLGRERYGYRADWMFRHAGLEAPRLPAGPNAA